MRRDLDATAVVLATLVALIAPFCLADLSAEDETPPDEGPDEPVETTVYGYVANISDQDRNVPLSGVTVTLMDGQMNILGTTVTDKDGRFEFTYGDADARYMTFEYEGYLVRVLPDGMEMDNGVVSFSIEKLIPDEEGKYALSGDGYSNHAVSMAVTNGYLYGYVHGTDGGETEFALEGATVTVTSSAGRTFTTMTNSEGYFEITVPYGEYVVSVSCNGFAGSEKITAGTYDISPIYITLDQNSSGIEILGGVDTPHAMLIFGLIIIGLVLMSLLLLMHKSMKPDSGITIINDLEELSRDNENLERP